jgi:2-polyprenyl-3-methyl-5-hydroxy-6-metoxy-1,4-benzoquinol methylase
MSTHPNNVDAYGWTSAAGPTSCGYIAPRVISVLQSLQVKRVLDLGSGNGALCGQLATRGFDVCGVDFDQQGVDLARTKYPQAAFHRFGVQDDPRELLSLEEPFDAVVSTEVIEHLYSPHHLPAFARGVLRQGGKLLVTTPYHGYLKNVAISLAGKWDHHHTALWHGGHIKFWSRKTLGQLLAAEGFSIEEFSGVGRLPYLWKSMVVVAGLEK